LIRPKRAFARYVLAILRGLNIARRGSFKDVYFYNCAREWAGYKEREEEFNGSRY